MAGKELSNELMQEAVDAVALSGGNRARAAEFLGIPRETLNSRINRAQEKGVASAIKPYEEEKPEPQENLVDQNIEARARKMLASKPCTLEDIAAGLSITRGQALDMMDRFKTLPFNLFERDGIYSIEREPAPQHAGGDLPVYTSRPDNTFVFGFTSDNHICSKYSRLDVLNDLYDRFAERGVDRVFNAGNWIDGEARFNKHDLLVHGMDRQLDYLAEHYPQRHGITTYAIAGDDHEGWYCQSMGVDIGAYAEMKMRQHGRNDFVNLGYMEAFVHLVNANSGAEAKLLNCHPGGGSAYAISYTSQKSIEAFEGGEKPAIALFGHYHKMMYAVIRNVHAIQTGCTEDQTPFMRKKKLSAHVGGGICRATQDPITGAIIACQVEFFNYFNSGYYNDRWSMSNDVTRPPRSTHS